MKVALVHDSFTQLGGAERVIKVFHEMYPEAPVFTLVIDQKFKSQFSGWKIRSSILQKLYEFYPKFQYLLGLIPFAITKFNFENFDLVISSSSAFVKNIKVPGNVTHICYCHTPARFLWTDIDYVQQEVPYIVRWLVKPILKKIKSWDYKGAQNVTKFLASSLEVQKRIKKFYQRESQVVYPFVDTNFWRPTKEKADYFLIAGRLQAHKHNELIIEIFNDLKLPLHVVGTGRQEKYLRSISKKNIKFFGRIDDEQLRDEYSGALGFLYPQVEDFGLMPLEAAACGTATLAYAKGGSLETVVKNKTGDFFYSYDKFEIKKKILEWKTNKFLIKDLTQHACDFSKEKFIINIQSVINSVLKDKKVN